MTLPTALTEALRGLAANVAAWLTTGVLVLASAAASAGAITVTPIRVELTPRRPVATLDVRNEGDDTVTVQIEKFDWVQADGADTYSASTSLVATPGVFELAPHGSQTLRVAIRDAQAGDAQRAFRLFAAEVPPDNPLDGPGLHMALRIGIPIFVESAEGASKLASELRPLSDGKSALHISNTGTRFTRLLSIEMRNAAGKALWHSTSPAYVLAGGEFVWTIEPMSIAPSAGEHLQLSLVTENGRERIDSIVGP